MRYKSEQKSECYFPPLLGNGDLSFAIDAEGTVHYEEKDFGGMECFDGVSYRARRRLQVGHERVPAKILSHGKLWFEKGEELKS